MNTSSLEFITCDELRDEFAKCRDDINKRILIIDVRNPALYGRSHLCLDSRHNIASIKTKMRVMNIDPDQLRSCVVKQIMTVLKEDDLKVFSRRRDATEVVIIDNDTDNISELESPRSKATRLINALTKFDKLEDRICVPIKILRGGFREWSIKYAHFTTDPSFNPDLTISDLKAPSTDKVTSSNNNDQTPVVQPVIVSPNDYKTPEQAIQRDDQPRNSPQSFELPGAFETEVPLLPVKQNTRPQIQPQPPRPPITKPVPPTPTRPVQVAPVAKPSIVKNAPGTAVPVTPMLSIRSPLPRSHSSPNVAQADDGDEFNRVLDELLPDLILGYNSKNSVSISNNYNHSAPSAPPALSKPRFDRTLKPSFNNESINAIRAQLNFGRSPEASGKAITGLQNLGNTCFMNSVIQCLAYAPTLASYFCSDSYYSHINFNSQYGTKGELAVEFGALVEKLNAHRHRYIEPKSFRESIVKHIGFAGNEQQDSHEFMMMLFDKLHHDLNIHAKDKLKQNGIVSNHSTGNNDDSNINTPRATLGYQFWKRHLDLNKSIISDLFEGIFMSTLTCTFCKGQSNTFEVFNCLSLPIPSESRCHLRDCLSHFSNPERIEAAWECPRCKQKREADKKIVICKLPRILIIHLKRFSLDGRWRQKLQTTVDFPLSDLRVDCSTVLPQSAYGPTPIKSSYNLYAVVNHYGHLDGGHYTAFCKLENYRWYTFDDSNVTEMKDTDVSGQAAYILFYGADC